MTTGGLSFRALPVDVPLPRWSARPAWPCTSPGAALLVLRARLLIGGQRGVVGPIGLAQGLLLLEHGRLVIVLVRDRGALQGALRGRDGCDFQRLVNVVDLRDQHRHSTILSVGSPAEPTPRALF